MAGRPTSLTDELLGKIKECVLEGKTLREIAKACEISEHTLYNWTGSNYANLSDKIEGWRRDSKLRQADIQLDKILRLDPSDKAFTPSILKAATFIKETLDKENYSKRTENTGENGGPIEFVIKRGTDNIE